MPIYLASRLRRYHHANGAITTRATVRAIAMRASENRLAEIREPTSVLNNLPDAQSSARYTGGPRTNTRIQPPTLVGMSGASCSTRSPARTAHTTTKLANRASHPGRVGTFIRTERMLAGRACRVGVRSCREGTEVIKAHSDRVEDANVRQLALGHEAVDGRRADA